MCLDPSGYDSGGKVNQLFIRLVTNLSINLFFMSSTSPGSHIYDLSAPKNK